MFIYIYYEKKKNLAIETGQSKDNLLTTTIKKKLQVIQSIVITEFFVVAILSEIIS